jgi:HD superfamily phosphohydrolase
MISTFTNKKKIINDPVFGFITIPHPLIFDLIQHPTFQRLRRIKQTGLSSYVYPGAVHTRFHHALGALHLMQSAVASLRQTGTEITENEELATYVAILLHDIGHSPFSHALEKKIILSPHEEISLQIMIHLNKVFNNLLSEGIQIFKGVHPKRFLSQLVSSQLDMDRMDYLIRDSFYTGVTEGRIGYDRIIKMLRVINDELVIEEKGILSVEKFLVARRIMYWQVYLHKTSIAAEQMLGRLFPLITKELQNHRKYIPDSLLFFFENSIYSQDIVKESNLNHFTMLDDSDIILLIKNCTNHSDPAIKFIASGLLNRQIFKVALKNNPIQNSYVEEIKIKISDRYPDFKGDKTSDVIIMGSESNEAYRSKKDEIKILKKSSEVVPLSEMMTFLVNSEKVEKFYICHPEVF